MPRDKDKTTASEVDRSELAECRIPHARGQAGEVDMYIDSGVIQAGNALWFTRFYVELNPSRNPRANSFNGRTNHPNRLGVSLSGGSYVSVRGRFVARSSSATASPSSSSSPRPRFVPTFAAVGELSVIAVVSVELLLEPSPTGVGDRADLLAEPCELVLDVEGGGNTCGLCDVDPCGVIGAGVVLFDIN